MENVLVKFAYTAPLWIPVLLSLVGLPWALAAVAGGVMGVIVCVAAVQMPD